MNRTKIEYLTHTWNPIAMRCSSVSEGCRHCWHLSMADRLAANPTMSYDRRQAYGGGVPLLLMDELTAPLRTRKPAVIGVQFMGDLFHEDVPDRLIDAVYAVMAASQKHTFIVLTKRPERMLDWAQYDDCCRTRACRISEAAGDYLGLSEREPGDMDDWPTWPLPNVVIGVSVEDQATADKRIPLLIQTPAACRVVSLEPMLEPVNLRTVPIPVIGPRETAIHRLDWVIMGCESGPGARPMQIEWARTVKEQCVAAGVPLFYKQGPGDWGNLIGMPILDGDTWAQKPERIQP